MAKQIKQSDFIDPSALEKVANDLQRIAEEGINADKAISKLAGDMKNLKVPNLNIKELSETEVRLKQVNKLYEDKAKIDLQNIKISQEQEKLAGIRERNERARAKEAERIAKQQAVADAKKLKAEKELNSAYQQTQKRASALYQQLRDLAIVGDTNSKAYRNLKKEYDQLDGSLKKVDATFGKHQRNVGNYPNAISGITSALSKLGIAFSGVAVARGVVNLFTELEDATASFRTIVSDLTDVEFSKFESKIEQVAGNTKSAMVDVANSFESIAGLNAEFAETADGLAQVSEAAITLSKASRDGLQPSAENLVSIMNQFGLEANQADRAINVLAAGQAVGAASITQLAESYKNVGAVAAGANLDIEQTTGLLEVLGKFSLFGAEAGTKLRGSILQLQKANLGYASGQFNMNDALAEFNKESEKFTTEAEKNAYATKVFGAENITAGRILSGNIDLINEYTKGVTGTNEALRAAEINSNTLSAAWSEFKNTLTNMIVSANGVDGAFSGLTKTLRWITANLPTIISLVGKLVIGFTAWRTVMFTMNLAQRVKDIGGLSGVFSSLTSNVNTATTSTSKFGNVLKGIGWTAVIALATDVAIRFYDIASGADEARRRSEAMFKAQQKGTKDVSQFLASIKDLRDLDSQSLLSNGGDVNKGVKEINERYDRIIKAEIKRLDEQKEAVKKSLAEFAKSNEAELKKNPLFRSAFTNAKEIALKSQIEEINTELKALYSELGGAETPFSKLTDLSNKIASSAKEAKDKINDWTKAIRDLNATQLGELRRAQAELFNQYQDNLDKIQANDIKAKEYRLALEKKYLKDLEKLTNEYEAEQDRKRKEAREKALADSLDALNIGADARLQNENLDRLQEYYNKRQVVIDKYANDQEKLEEELSNLEYENNRKSLEQTISFAQEKIEAIRKIYEELLGSDDDLLSEADLKAKKEFEKQINDYQTEILNAEIELQNMRAENNKKTVGSLEDFWKKSIEGLSKLIEMIQSRLNKLYDTQINRQNRIIDLATEQKNRLTALYAEGNQKATESILAETKRQEEALRRIEQIEKRRMRMQMLTSFLSAFSQGASGFNANTNGKDVINTFMNSLPKFKVGTEYFSTTGTGVDGEGGAPAILHNKERVLTQEQNAMIGYTTPNKVVAETMYKVRTGQLSEGKGVNPIEVIKPLAEEIKEGFKNITSVNTNIDSIIDGVITATTTKRQGRVSIIDRKKYKA